MGHGLNINGEQLSKYRFTNDDILFATTKDHLQNMIEDLKRESLVVGLTNNILKTKAMTNSTEYPMIINGRIIEYVKEYIYILGPKAIDTRIGNTWKSYWFLK